MNKNKSIVVLPQIEENLRIMGEQIKLARLRRGLSSNLVAQRANVSRTTLWNIENGSSKVARIDSNYVLKSIIVNDKIYHSYSQAIQVVRELLGKEMV